MDPSLSFEPSQPPRSCQYRPSHLRQANPRPTSAQLPREDLWELIKDQLALSSPIDVAGFLGTDRNRESIPRKEDFPEICRSVERSAGYKEGTQQDRIHRLFKFLAQSKIASKTFRAILDQSIERKANVRTSSSKTTAASSNTRGRSSVPQRTEPFISACARKCPEGKPGLKIISIIEFTWTFSATSCVICT